MLPALPDRLSWLPVDIAARVCLELASCAHPAGAAPCFNVVNPRLLPWENLLKLLKQAGLEFDVVERREWVCAPLSRPAAGADARLDPTSRSRDSEPARTISTRTRRGSS